MKSKRSPIYRTLGIFTVLVYGAVLLAVFTPNCAPAPDNDLKQAPIASPQEDDVDREQLVGFAISVHKTYDPSTFFPSIDRIHEMGGNSIKIVTPGYQTHGASVEIGTPEHLCPTKEQLQRIILYARAKGMRVTLMPIVLFEKPRGNEWRGKLTPTNWNQWWASYNAFILEFAVFAEDNGVDTFSVGSELLSTEKETERWDHLIAQTREVFSGKLTYSTNWDHYHHPQFWSKLDMIGLNAYWELTEKNDVPDTELIRKWVEIRRKVLAYAKEQQRPILFTEVGYPSLSWALQDPWNYVARGAKSDEDTQARGHMAFWNAWWDLLGPTRPDYTKNPLAGVFVYEWTNTDMGGPDDTSYSVWNKKAYHSIRERMQKRLKDE